GDDFRLCERNLRVDSAGSDCNIYSVVGRHDIVGWTAMAIEAVHAANIMWRRVAFEIIGSVFGRLTLGVSHAHPRDRFGVFIGGEVLDLISDIHVPVNSANRSARRITAADV